MADEDVQRLLCDHHYALAFELILQRYEKKVFYLAYSILKESANAEDVAQDVFVKLWQVLPLYDGRAAVSTWLYTISRNTALSALRAKSYRNTLPFEECDPPAVDPEPGLRRLQLKEVLPRLSQIEQEIVTLFYLQQCSVEDVAGMLDVPAGTVKSHLHRARRRLAELMRS
ncbi:MAG TPA: sigma-70 family RNA polymerase sigma factor [Terriglobales bacterium]|jgi:RNA polymerase sigma-70 factor (ECF subfamily)|nr:sigma-70 family RNA polymerase sigma factor [Terriglobales bacterium]